MDVIFFMATCVIYWEMEIYIYIYIYIYICVCVCLYIYICKDHLKHFAIKVYFSESHSIIDPNMTCVQYNIRHELIL